jgi:hypothetical protein
MSRTLNVVRLQLVNKMTFLWIPLIILFGSLAFTLIVYSMLPPGAVKYGGGAQAPLWYFLAIGIQAMAYSFPFSQAMSITRREFFAGTLLTAALTAAILSSVFVVGGFIEQATNGYGLDGYFFYMDWLWVPGWWAAWIGYFAIAMFMFVVGFWAATIYKRWGAIAVTVVLVGVGALLIAAIWLTGRLNAWAAVLDWFASQGSLGLTVWGIVVVAILAAMSFLTLRRATP